MTEQVRGTSAFVDSEAPYKDLPTANKILFRAKAEKGLSFAEIGKEIDRDEVWVAAVFYGQAVPTKKDIEGILKVLVTPDAFTVGEGSLSGELTKNSGISRGALGPMPPTDPVIYRLYEGLLVYGYPIKSIIHEKFGDGIMSLIDCKVHVDRKEDPKGDRVVLTFDGKFLSYAKW